MTAENVINADWSDYNLRKTEEGRNVNDFSCKTEWEVEYLKEKIKSIFPNYTDESILMAIRKCCHLLKSPHNRTEFIIEVLNLINKNYYPNS